MQSRRKLPWIVVSVLFGFFAFVMVLMWMGIPEIRVKNDLEFDVSLRGCVEWQRIASRQSDGVRPHVPCRVYRISGSHEVYLGCLQIRDDAFEGITTLISQLDSTIDSDVCESLDDYRGHARVRKVLSPIGEWF